MKSEATKATTAKGRTILAVVRSPGARSLMRSPASPRPSEPPRLPPLAFRPSADEDDVFLRAAQPLRAVLGDDDHLFDRDDAASGHGQPRLDGEDHALLELLER